MEAASPIDHLPPELLRDILSRLDWRQQLGVRRVSRGWRAAVDACLSTQYEMHIDLRRRDVPIGKVIALMEGMPNLRRLNMVPGFRSALLDSASVERLCTSCPHLHEVSLFCGLDEAGLKTLLRRLPGLRVLDLSCPGSRGGFLSLLPTALESLSLRDANHLEPASIRQMTRCPQLRELRLDYVSGDVLETMLAACLQVERLFANLSTPMSDWHPALSLCQQLRHLHVGGVVHWHDGVFGVAELQILAVLTACRRLERLRVHSCGRLTLPRPVHGSVGQRHQFGLTQLEIRYTGLDDSAFSRLADMLPGLRNLILGQPTSLSESGLASGLRRFTKLEALELGDPFIITPASPVLAALSDLPLEKLACFLDDEPEDIVRGVASVLRHCPRLAVLCLPGNQLDSCQSLAKQLAANPPVQNEVTLALDDPVPEDAVLLPRNVRVLSSVTSGYSTLFCELDEWRNW